MAAQQANGGTEITESIGKTLFIQNMTDKNMRLLAASSNATTTKDVIKYVKEKELILGEKPTHEDASGACGFCHKTNHTERNCNQRRYAQKLLKISPDNAANNQSDTNNGGNGRNNNNRQFNRSNGDRSFNGGRRFNNNGQFNNNNNSSQNYRSNNGNGNNGNNYQNRSNGNNGNNNFQNRGNNQNSNNFGGNSNNHDNANGNRNNQNSNNGNGNAGNSNRNNYRNNGQANNQRMTLTSQNEHIHLEDNAQIPLHELQAHAQFHATNSEN